MDSLKIFPAGEEKPVIYLLSGEESCAALFDGRASLVCIPVRSWDSDLTPWPAPGLNAERSFTGGGPAFLERLTVELIPEAEKALGFAAQKRGIAGYSLGGLFALYALSRTELFTCAASVSGSLWYDDWLAYFQTHLPTWAERVYLSVGSREKRARNPRMAAVEDCTLRAAELLQGSGVTTCFERNPGGHFQDPEGRILRAIDWLLQP